MTPFPFCGLQQGYERDQAQDYSFCLSFLRLSIQHCQNQSNGGKEARRDEGKDSVTAFKNFWGSSYKEPRINGREFFIKGIQHKINRTVLCLKWQNITNKCNQCTGQWLRMLAPGLALTSAIFQTLQNTLFLYIDDYYYINICKFR